MRSSRPLMGDNGSTHLLSDVYYIQVHLSFRGSWPRVTPRAIKPDCGPNLTGTGTGTTRAHQTIPERSQGCLIGVLIRGIR